MHTELKSFDDFCPRCSYFNPSSGACSKIHENVQSYPSRFQKKCNGEFYVEDPDKAILSEVREEDIQEREALRPTDMKSQMLKSQTTLRLFLLTAVTYAVYPVYYLRRLTNLLNEDLTSDRRISESFATANFVFAYLSLSALVVYLFVPEGHPAETISWLADRLSLVLILVWSFKVRNRINYLRALAPGSASWFSGLWTFLFQYLYINYKINIYFETQSKLGVQADEGEPATQP